MELAWRAFGVALGAAVGAAAAWAGDWPLALLAVAMCIMAMVAPWPGGE